MMLAARDATRLVALVFLGALICAGHVEGFNGAVSVEGSDDSLCRPQQVHLALTSDPTEMRVMWKTLGSSCQPGLQHWHLSDLGSDVSDAQSLLARSGGNAISSSYSSDDMCASPAKDFDFAPLNLHTFIMTDLEPGEWYEYRLRDSSDTLSFRASPRPGPESQVSFVVYGDMGESYHARAKAPGARATADYVTRDVIDNDVDLVVHVGDLSYANGDPEIWDTFMDYIEPYSSRAPYMIGIGNHEYDYRTGKEKHRSHSKDPSGASSPYDPDWGNYGNDSGGECGVATARRFIMPEAYLDAAQQEAANHGSSVNSPFWYSFDYGSVHFVMLSTEHDVTPGSHQYRWLEQHLEGIDRCLTPWLVVGMHRPMYVVHPHKSNRIVAEHLRASLESLFNQYNVDLVVSGHVHSYARTCNVYDEQCVDNLDKGVPGKKKSRNADPGVRVQGGRIYCSKTGTTCHQCRQKTVEDKRQCSTCIQQFCPKCLTNRYGPGQEQASKQPNWSCPKCQKNCSCSYCRKKAGLAPTGILANAAKTLGFASVAALLAVNPDAAAVMQAAKDAKPQAESKTAGKAMQAVKAGMKRKNSEHCEEGAPPAVPDQDLGPRPNPMPVAQSFVLHCPQGQMAVWPTALPCQIALPADCSPGDLLEVLEFAQVFSQHLLLAGTHAAALAAELVQEPFQGPNPFEASGPSLLKQLHVQLLTLLCKAQEVKIRLTGDTWQQETCQRFFHQASAPEAAPQATSDSAGALLGMAPTGAGQGTAAPVGYWQLAPGVRLRMLRDLCLAALDTYIFKQYIETAMEESSNEEKQQREALTERRKQARADIKRLQEQEIALLIANGQGEGLSLEEQKCKLAEARGKAEAALAKGDRSEADCWLGQGAAGVRGVALGCDRDGMHYWKLQAAEALGGGLLVQTGSDSKGDSWQVHRDTTAVAAALDSKGLCEGALKRGIAAAFPPAATRPEESTDIEATANPDAVEAHTGEPPGSENVSKAGSVKMGSKAGVQISPQNSLVKAALATGKNKNEGGVLNKVTKPATRCGRLKTARRSENISLVANSP
ncbi:hypothetical protein WJX79_005106 [Trebouxia sp. C0005]